MATAPTEPHVCPKCDGRGHYHYDHNHGKPCEACCPHNQGWWQLGEIYDSDAGKWCCKRGCGLTVDDLPGETQA